MANVNWTDARFRAFIVGVLRAGARRWPPKYETLHDAYVGVKLNEKTKREGKHYRCACCHADFPAKEVQVDHILPVVDPVVGFVDWNTFIERLYCGKENLQVLCISCHKEKSKRERYGTQKTNG